MSDADREVWEVMSDAIRPSTGVWPMAARPLTREEIRAALEHRVAVYSDPPPVHPRDYLRALVGLDRDPSMTEPLTHGDYVTGLAAWGALRGDDLVVAERRVDLAWADHLASIRERIEHG